MQKEIDPNDWSSFFESFATAHAHALVSVDGEKAALPLEGLTARGSRIDVHLGTDISNYRRITVEAARVLLEQHGAGEGLEIQAVDGHIVRLQFRAAAGT